MGQWSDSLLATILAQGVGGGALQLWAGHAASLLVERYMSEPASREFHVGQSYLRQLAAQGVSKEEGSFWSRVRTTDDHLWLALSTFKATAPENRVVIRLLELLCFKAPSASVCTRAFGVLLKIAGSPENIVLLLKDPFSPAHRLAVQGMSAERRVALALTILSEVVEPAWYLVGLELLCHPDQRDVVLARGEAIKEVLLGIVLGPKRVGQTEVSECLLTLFPDDAMVVRVSLFEVFSFEVEKGGEPGCGRDGEIHPMGKLAELLCLVAPSVIAAAIEHMLSLSDDLLFPSRGYSAQPSLPVGFFFHGLKRMSARLGLQTLGCFIARNVPLSYVVANEAGLRRELMRAPNDVLAVALSRLHAEGLATGA